MSTTTTNLQIPLLEGSMVFSTDSFNDAFKAIDANALAKPHAAEKSHWDLWKPNTTYKKQDVFRTTTIPSWGFWEVTKAGTSGTMEPVGYGEDDTFTDGTCELVLRRLTKGGEAPAVQGALQAQHLKTLPPRKRGRYRRHRRMMLRMQIVRLERRRVPGHGRCTQKKRQTKPFKQQRTYRQPSPMHLIHCVMSLNIRPTCSFFLMTESARLLRVLQLMTG